MKKLPNKKRDDFRQRQDDLGYQIYSEEEIGLMKERDRIERIIVDGKGTERAVRKKTPTEMVREQLPDTNIIETPSGRKFIDWRRAVELNVQATNLWKEWLKINIACYQKTQEFFKDLPIYLGLVLSKERLNDGAEIIEAISSVKPNGVLLWIDEHVEETLGGDEIVRYVSFLQRLDKVVDTTYNSHGGYLSILLCHSEAGSLLDGVGHSMNYGEHRAVVPIGGGLPMAQFYLLSVHSRLRWGDAASIVQPIGWLGSTERYRQNVCTCHQCLDLIEETGSAEAAFDVYGRSHPVTITRRTGVIVRLEYPTREAKQSATRHYLYNKVKEFKDIGEKNFSQLLVELSSAYDTISSDTGEDFVGHLFTWNEALSGLITS